MSELLPCPYPCGWDELNEIIVKKAAMFAVKTLDDDIHEDIRQLGIDLGKYARELSRMSKVPPGYVMVPIDAINYLADQWPGAYNHFYERAMIEAAGEGK